MADKLHTFPSILKENARLLGRRESMREKNLGIWQSWSWSEVCTHTCALAAGLAAKGFGRDDKLAIVGDNRPHLYWAMAAVQSLGGVPVPMYQDSVADELKFVLSHCEAKFALAEDQEQVDKLIEIKDACPMLELIIYDDPRGLKDYELPYLIAFSELAEAGRRHQSEHPGFVDTEIGKGVGGDVAVILYTSGTTGEPKGVMLTHDSLRIMSEAGRQRDNLSADDEVLAYLPMAWVGDHVFSYCQALVTGFCVSCPESADTVLTDLREIGPSYFFAPPRIYENLLTTVMIRMEDAGFVKRKLFSYFLGVAKRCGSAILDGRKVGVRQRFAYALGDFLIFGPLRNTLGFSRIRLAYTAGEAIGPDIFEFYRSLGVNVKQLYGQTESSVYITMQPDGEVRPDTVGTAAPGVELKIADNGEVLYRSPGVFEGYYKNPQATAKAKTEDGWVLTGDAGFLGADGHLKIIDRAKDVGKMNDGTLFAPKYLENKLKFFPEIKEAVVFGNGEDYAAAMLNIDLEAVSNWAERNNVAFASYQELAASPSVCDLVMAKVQQVNRDLASDPQLRSSQIQRFLVLPKELDADDGELTRTRKVRRGYIGEKYAALVAALYSGSQTASMDTEVRFEDGSKGSVHAELSIHSVATH